MTEGINDIPIHVEKHTIVRIELNRVELGLETRKELCKTSETSHVQLV